MLLRWSALAANGLLIFFNWRLAASIDYYIRKEHEENDYYL